MKKILILLVTVNCLLFGTSNLESSPILFTSDKKAFSKIELDTLPELTLNCPFSENSNNDGFISDDEYEIMNYCFENRIVDSSGISNAILGTWELIGHGEGWIPSYSQPCITVDVTELLFKIEYSDSFIEKTTIHAWRVVEGTNNFFLEFFPPINNGSGFGIICSDYSYLNATPGDGNMYLYRKKQVISSINNFPEENYSPISVYPNPTTGLIKISQSKKINESNNIKVYNLLGQHVFCEYYYESDGSILLDLSNQIKGSYYIVINQDGKLEIEKIVLI